MNTKKEIAGLIRLHEVWLEDPSRGQRMIAEGIEFKGAWLRGCNLSRATLRHCTFRGNIIGRRFRESCLRFSDFTGADLRGCDFRSADLRGCNFTGARLDGCDLTGALLTSATLEGVSLTGAVLQDVVTGENLAKLAEESERKRRRGRKR